MKEISVEELKELKKSNDIVHIDIRSTEDFNNVSYPDSINYPSNSILDHLSELDKNKKYVISCYKGVSSSKLAMQLEAHGYETYSLIKGIQAVTEF